MNRAIVTAFALLLFISCRPKEEVVPTETPVLSDFSKSNQTDTLPLGTIPRAPTCPGNMFVTMNGLTYTPIDYANTLFIQEKGTQASRRLDIRANVNGGTLVISVLNWAWQNPASNGVVEKVYFNDPLLNTCETFLDGKYCDEMTATFYKGGEEDTWRVTREEIASVVITGIQEESNTVSGNFKFTLKKQVGGTIISMTGSFNHLCYKIITEK